jgi:hypothetical protein
MNSTSLDCKIEIIQIYILPIMSIFGILFNGLSIITFSHMIIKNPKLLFLFCFKSYLSKSISNFLLFIIQIFGFLYYCRQCGLSNSLFSNIWFVYFFNFAQTPFVSCSAFYEIIALIDFLSIIKNGKNFLHKIKFRYLFIGVLIASFLFESFILFRYEIISQSTNVSTIFAIKKTNFYDLELDKYLRFIDIFVRHIFSFFLIIILNILILYEIRKSAKRKQNINQRNNKNKVNIRDKNIAEKATRKTLFILIITSSLYLMGHILLIVYYLPFDKSNKQSFWLCYYYDLALTPFYFSYICHFFIYFGFNKHFQNSFNIIFINRK